MTKFLCFNTRLKIKSNQVLWKVKAQYTRLFFRNWVWSVIYWGLRQLFLTTYTCVVQVFLSSGSRYVKIVVYWVVTTADLLCFFYLFSRFEFIFYCCWGIIFDGLKNYIFLWRPSYLVFINIFWKYIFCFI